MLKTTHKRLLKFKISELKQFSTKKESDILTNKFAPMSKSFIKVKSFQKLCKEKSNIMNK